MAHRPPGQQLLILSIANESSLCRAGATVYATAGRRPADSLRSTCKSGACAARSLPFGRMMDQWTLMRGAVAWNPSLRHKHLHRDPRRETRSCQGPA
jgi:hypothetical protein